MKVIVGLGNPGNKYENTRHNVGFMAVDALVDANNLSWEENSKFNAFIAKGAINDKNYMFVKPTTFMNNSGEAVSKIVHFYNIDLDNLVVVHDDVDLKMGQTKYKKGMSSAGHHGIEDIFEKLGSKYFWRFRIGVGRPKEGAPHDVKDFVLKEDFDFDIDFEDLQCVL